eukprot:g7048.t1
MDASRVGEFFGGRHGYPEWERLVEIAEVGVPLSSVRSGGDLERELEYGNHRSAAEEEPAVWEKVLRDVATGKALVFPKRMAGQIPGLRVSPMGVVKEKEGKIREIHDLTVEVGEGRSVNASTEFSEIPECTMASALKRLITRLLQLRKDDPTAHLVLQKMDLKGAFRHIPVDPGGAQVFGYLWGDLLVVDLRLPFGWRGSPGWFGLVAGGIEHAQCNITVDTVVRTPSGVKAVEHVRVEPPSGRPLAPVPTQCKVPSPGKDQEKACTVFYVDDAMSLERRDVGRCLALSQSLASIHHIMLGERGEGDEPVLSKKKTTNWAPAMEIQGYWVDTESLTIGLPDRKVAQIRDMLEKWPADRTTATVGEVLSLAGKLHHAAFVIRPARYYVRRLLQLSNLHLSGSEKAGSGEVWGAQRKAAEQKRRLKLTPEFMADVGWWRWYLGRAECKVGESITSPAFTFAEQKPVQPIGEEARRMFSEILREATHLEELRSRLARVIRGIGGCGVHGERQ